MSAQFRTEWSKMVDKYARTFGVDPSLVKAASVLNKLLGFYEDSVWCPSRPDLPVWGMGSNSEDWEDGPTQDLPRWVTRPPKTVLVSRRKR